MSEQRTSSGILHLLLTADRVAWEACAACCAPGDSVVLLDRSVMGLVHPDGFSNDLFNCRVVASLPDANARGLSVDRLEIDVEVIGDDVVMQLIEAHPRCLSWR